MASITDREPRLAAGSTVLDRSGEAPLAEDSLRGSTAQVVIDLTGPEPVIRPAAPPLLTLVPDLPEEDADRPGAPEARAGDVGAVSLGVIMPVYNEEATVRQAVADVLSVEFPCPVQLIVVNDGSTDATPEILAGLQDPRLVVIHHEVNRGKGAALRTGAAAADTTHVVPFDADLEYSAADLVPMLEPVVTGEASIVYGTRRTGKAVPHSSFIYAVGNSVMTRFANQLYGSAITDLHTCLKLVPREVFTRIPLFEEGFGLDTELTAWLLRTGMAFSEVPISYHSRSRAEGKKITWRDSLACLHILLLIRMEQTTA